MRVMIKFARLLLQATTPKTATEFLSLNPETE
jgi:hypothetical protein